MPKNKQPIPEEFHSIEEIQDFWDENSMDRKNGKQMQKTEIGKFLVRDPEIYHGELTFKGTRVPVDVVLGYIAKGLAIGEVAEHWPDVSTEAVLEALSFAKQALMEKYVKAA